VIHPARVDFGERTDWLIVVVVCVIRVKSTSISDLPMLCPFCQRVMLDNRAHIVLQDSCVVVKTKSLVERVEVEGVGSGHRSKSLKLILTTSLLVVRK